MTWAWRRLALVFSTGVVVLIVLALCACVSSGSQYPLSQVACGVTLAEDCYQRVRSYGSLPSNEQASASPDFEGERSPQAQYAYGLKDRGFWGQAAPWLEETARGQFGDSLETRQEAEYHLAVALQVTRDDGGSFDLARLMLAESLHGQRDKPPRLIERLAIAQCPSRPVLTLLAAFHDEHEWRHGCRMTPRTIQTAKADAMTARGLVEVGRSEEARVILASSRVVEYYPDFAARCLAYIGEHGDGQSGMIGVMRQDRGGHDEPATLTGLMVAGDQWRFTQQLGVEGPPRSFRQQQSAYLRSVLPRAADFAESQGTTDQGLE